jgi:hypothetical protein
MLESVMGTVMIKCPKTGEPISTGIRMSRSGFNRAPVFFAHTYCPACQGEHEWFARDAWLKEDLRKSDAAARPEHAQ